MSKRVRELRRWVGDVQTSPEEIWSVQDLLGAILAVQTSLEVCDVENLLWDLLWDLLEV